MSCPSCGSEADDQTSICPECVVQRPERRSTTRKIFKWGGIGCGGLLVLFILLIIIGLLVDPPPSEDEQTAAAPSKDQVTNVEPSGENRRESFPIPSSWTHREVLLAGTESGDNLRGLGRKLDDDFVQDAVATVESDVFGDAGNWMVTNSDMIAVCDIYSRMGDALQRGQPITPDEFEDILQNEVGAEGAALIGAIQSGISDNGDELVEFCMPFTVYGIGFIAAFETAGPLYGHDPSETNASVQLDRVVMESRKRNCERTV